MNILKKSFCFAICTNVAVILAIMLLPALLISTDIDIIQSIIEHVNK